MSKNLHTVYKMIRSTSLRLPVLLAGLIALAIYMLFPTQGRAATLRVPQDYATIQEAIGAAQDGDIVLVSPGTYNETLEIVDKTITLASEYHNSADPAHIDQTIIDGGGGDAAVITVDQGVGPETQIIGFTIRNGNDGISTRSQIRVLNNHILTNLGDGIDSRSGGGLIRGNTFENNGDDGVDFDQASSGTIEGNLIRGNGNDGIEVRLHDYTGPVLNIVIRGNTIEGSVQDGIQLIDFPGISDRVFTIERNLIRGNTLVGLGLMDNGQTNEDFRAASIPERIYVFNNTFAGNSYAITGGDNLIAVNNIFTGAATLALKNIDGGSIVAHNLFWNNAIDQQGSNIDSGATLAGDPLLASNFALQPGSPAIDAGVASFTWNGETVLSYPPGAYTGSSPDLGWWESNTESPIPSPTPEPTPMPTPNPNPAVRIFLMKIWNGGAVSD
jgi:hypothetical protein